MGRYHATAMNETPDTLRVPAGVRLSRTLAVASTLGLILLGLAWELWLAPLRPGGSWLALKVLPLALALSGLLKLRMYTYRWLSLAVWLYFTEACVRGWSDAWPSNALAMAEGVLCLVLFVACGMHVRLRFKAARAMAPKESHE
jgi:uncharacterized membrane protein